MKTIRTSITINAPSHVVWEVLMNHGEYSNWNPFIRKVAGEPQVGETIEVTLQPEKKKPMNFTPKVIANESGKEFRWVGHLFVKGLFDGEHYFQLEEISPSQTRFIHGEQFRGVMAAVLLKMVGEDTKRGFEAMNSALKTKVESQNN